jgi:hypothetical protein
LENAKNMAFEVCWQKKISVQSFSPKKIIFNLNFTCKTAVCFLMLWPTLKLTPGDKVGQCSLVQIPKRENTPNNYRVYQMEVKYAFFMPRTSKLYRNCAILVCKYTTWQPYQKCRSLDLQILSAKRLKNGAHNSSLWLKWGLPRHSGKKSWCTPAPN